MTRLLKKFAKIKQESNAKRLDILKKVTEVDESGNMLSVNGEFKVKEELKADFEEEMGEFLHTKIDIKSFPVELRDFEVDGKLPITPFEIELIKSFLITDDME